MLLGGRARTSRPLGTLVALRYLAVAARSSMAPPGVSKTIAATDAPVIVKMQRLTRGKDVASLAQGIVHWKPPPASLEAAKAALDDPATHGYGNDEGSPALVAALGKKLETKNALTRSDVMVTSGCNQAFTNVCLALLDAGDTALLFRPYYFNHLMQLQMLGVDVALPAMTEELLPDVAALTAALDDGGTPPKLVVLVNPGNPTGKMIPKPLLQEVADLCASRGVWLVVDNTYELFAYEGGEPHACVEGDHVINLFSFSKAYGMMGWRVGYVAHPPRVAPDLLKAQDTVAICASIASQHVALAALRDGDAYVEARVAGLVADQKAMVLDALAPLGPGAVKGGDGAIYLLAKLPPHAPDDVAVVEWLVDAHGVATIPGTACGLPGFIRVCYANLPKGAYAAACTRLRAACAQLADPAFALPGAAA